MKRRGFLGLLGSLPFVPKVVLAKEEEVPPAATFKLADVGPPPAISFTNDTNTGIYRVGNDNIRFRN